MLQYIPRNMQLFRILSCFIMLDLPHKGQWRGADVFLDLRLDKRLSKQSRRRWFETQSHWLWRHCDADAIKEIYHTRKIKKPAGWFFNWLYVHSMTFISECLPIIPCNYRNAPDEIPCRGQFYQHGLILIPARISNNIHYRLWDEITYLIPIFNSILLNLGSG